MPTLIVPRIPSVTMKSQGRERRMAAPKGSSITRRAMETMVSVKWIIVQILWLTPTHRIMVSIVSVNRPRRVEDQVSILSAC